jgi:MscS family membrane protein
MWKNFKVIYHSLIVVLLVLLVASVWAAAQTATNPPAPATNTVAAAEHTSDTLDALSNKLGVNRDFLLSFGLDQYEALRQPFLGHAIWKYFASLIYICLAWLASRGVDFIFQKLLRRWTQKTETQLDDLLVDLFKGPVKVIVFVILMHVGLNVFDWPAWVSKYLSKGLKLVIAWSITYMAVRAVDIFMRHLQSRVQEEDKEFNAQLFPVIRKTLKVFIVLVAILVTAQNLDFQITGMLASLSIGGLALGLAAQDTLANLFGAVSIFADKPFRIGDRITMDNVDGNVETIGLRSTRIRNLDGHLITVPNKTIANATITNISRRPSIRTLMYVSITYNTPPERIQLATDILKEVYNKHPMTADLIVAFQKFNSYSLDILVVHWWKGVVYKEYLEGMHVLNLEVKRRFDEAGIEFAFPTQTVYVNQAGGVPPVAPPPPSAIT